MLRENTTSQLSEEKEEGFDFQTIIMKLIIYWRWFVVSVVACLFCAFVYLRYAIPVYKIQATIMINDDKKGTYQNQMMALQDFGFLNTTGGIDNEIEILRSKSLIKQAVEDLKLYTTYIIQGRISKRPIYKSYPLEVDFSDPNDVEKLNSSLTLEINRQDSASYLIEYVYRDIDTHKKVKVKKVAKIVPHTSYPLDTHIGNLLISLGDGPELQVGQTLYVSIVPPIKKAKSCLTSLSIEPTSKTTSVAYVSFLDANPRRGVDFVNQLVAAYNRENNNDKNLVAIKTDDFIKDRLKMVSSELGETEKELAEYKQSSGLTNLTGDAQMILQGSSEYEKKSVEVRTQLNLVQFLREFVNDPANNLQVIPANVGLTDASLTTLITRYNEGIVERNRLLRTSTESNPTVIDITTSVQLLANTIRTSIESVYKTLNIQIKDINSQIQKFDTKINDAPVQERKLAGYARTQEVKSGLYLMLLQKREENSITMAAVADNAKIIDAALSSDFPISPKRRMVWLVALVIGCALPIAIIYLLEMLRYKIEGRNDLDKLTKIPVLGDVVLSHGLKKGERAIVVKENDNDMMAETFRSIRTNLQFMLGGPDKKIVLFTSTTSGEGKTFVSSNMAMSLALLGKKVILMGLDIRKPRLADMFDLPKKNGITSFLVGDPDDKDLLFSLIQPSGISPYLDILPSGIVPPNPAELLSKVNLEKAVEYLSERYDYIILDTAPIGLVTDTLIVARVADACVYVCRADYTPKNDIQLANSLYLENKMKNMSIVLNGVDMAKRKYGYYYGNGYGRYGKYGYGKYGYGRHYGYGYGYGHDSNKKE